MEVNVSGKITIYPPLSHDEILAAPGLVHEEQPWPGQDRDAFVEVVEFRNETSDGTLIKRQGVAIKGADNEFSHSRMTEQIAEIVAAFPDRAYVGYLECSSPDDGGEQWRVTVKDGRVVDIYPEVTWPEGGNGITITREQLEAWAGRALTEDEVESLDECLPSSGIPEAIGQIVDGFGTS